MKLLSKYILCHQVEREAGENKRLSMENEQLSWRMNQEASLSFRQANLRASSLFLHQMAF
jgi:hypothetical protein